MGQEQQTWWQQIWGFLQVTFETWKFLSSLTTLLLAVGATSGVWGFFTTNFLYIAGGVLSVLIAGIVGITLLFLTNRIARKYKTRILDKYVTYRYQPDLKTMEHTKDYKIIALAEKVDSFIDRYKWSCTNQGKIDVELINPEQDTTNQKLLPKKDGEWSINEIVFTPPLHKGEKASVLLRWDLYCEGDSQTFLSQIVDEPTDKLTLSVTLPYDPVNIRFFEFNDGDGIESLPHTIVTKNGVDDKDRNYYLTTREVRYSVNKPKLGHKYMIKWDSPAVGISQ